ncbi:MAG: hypothetical protein ACFCBU_16065 [Cyanophyceae cyanobacterium]
MIEAIEEVLQGRSEATVILSLVILPLVILPLKRAVLGALFGATATDWLGGAVSFGAIGWAIA